MTVDLLIIMTFPAFVLELHLGYFIHFCSRREVADDRFGLIRHQDIRVFEDIRDKYF